MTNSEVIELAIKIAKCCGLRLRGTEQILKKMRGQFPVTTIIQNKDYILWIDKHYVAVSGNGLDSFLYIYIAEHHVLEELRDVVAQREKTENIEDYNFFSSIIEPLLAAQENIRKNNCGYFLLENYLPQIKEMAL